jgi:hypothetical protein
MFAKGPSKMATHPEGCCEMQRREREAWPAAAAAAAAVAAGVAA